MTTTSDGHDPNDESLMERDARDVTPGEVRRRVQRAIRQLRMVDADLALVESAAAEDESLVSVARRLGAVQTQIEVARTGAERTRDSDHG